jgi:hypothetical protein
MSTKIVAIESTDWFDARKKLPGQPGVFEVDPILVDVGPGIPRYSYHNGRDFGPVALSVEDAFKHRLGGRATEVTKFRGLVEAA